MRTYALQTLSQSNSQYQHTNNNIHKTTKIGVSSFHSTNKKKHTHKKLVSIQSLTHPNWTHTHTPTHLFIYAMYLVPPLILASSSIYPSCNKNKKSWSNNNTTRRLPPASTHTTSNNRSNRARLFNSHRTTTNISSTNSKTHRKRRPPIRPLTTNRKPSTSLPFPLRRILSSKISKPTRTDTIPRGGPTREGPCAVS